MYTDGAIYYVLYCDQVLKYLQEITRKPEKLCCPLWVQLTKTIIEWAQYIKHCVLRSRLTEKDAIFFSIITETIFAVQLLPIPVVITSLPLCIPPLQTPQDGDLQINV